MSLVAAKNISMLDVDEQLATTNPPPAGWAVKSGGCCGIFRPIDPYGNRLYIQLQAGGGFYMQYPANQTISGAACRTVIDYIMTAVYNKLITVTLLSFGGGSCTALLSPSPAANYSANKMNILEACCPSTGLGFYGILPN